LRAQAAEPFIRSHRRFAERTRREMYGEGAKEAVGRTLSFAKQGAMITSWR